MFVEKIEKNTLSLLGAFEYPHYNYVSKQEMESGRKTLDESAMVIKINRNVNVYNMKMLINHGTLEIDNVQFDNIGLISQVSGLTSFIKNCVFTNIDSGIEVQESNKFEVDMNDFINSNKTVISINQIQSASEYLSISQNRIINNQVGIEFKKNDERLKIKMQSNVIIDSKQYGMKNYYKQNEKNQIIQDNVIGLSKVGLSVTD